MCVKILKPCSWTLSLFCIAICVRFRFVCKFSVKNYRNFHMICVGFFNNRRRAIKNFPHLVWEHISCTVSMHGSKDMFYIWFVLPYSTVSNKRPSPISAPCAILYCWDFVSIRKIKPFCSKHKTQHHSWICTFPACALMICGSRPTCILHNYQTS